MSNGDCEWLQREREHLINCCAILKSEHFNFFQGSHVSVDCRLIFFADVTSRTFKCYKATTTMVCKRERKKCTRKYFSLTCATSVQDNLRHVQNRKCINEREIFDKCCISASLCTQTHTDSFKKSINLIKNSF